MMLNYLQIEKSMVAGRVERSFTAMILNENLATCSPVTRNGRFTKHNLESWNNSRVGHD